MRILFGELFYSTGSNVPELTTDFWYVPSVTVQPVQSSFSISQQEPEQVGPLLWEISDSFSSEKAKTAEHGKPPIVCVGDLHKCSTL